MSLVEQQIAAEDAEIRAEKIKIAEHIAQSKVQLFVERNRYKNKADLLELRVIAMQGAADQVKALEHQLYEQRVRSSIIISILLCIIVLLFGGYILCLKTISDPLKQELFQTTPFGNAWSMTE